MCVCPCVCVSVSVCVLQSITYKGTVINRSRGPYGQQEYMTKIAVFF